jgi:hypothetical protein
MLDTCRYIGIWIGIIILRLRLNGEDITSLA